MGPNDRSNGRHTTSDQGPGPVDWVLIVFAVVFIGLVMFAVLYVRV